MHGSEYAQCFQRFRSNAVIFRLFRVSSSSLQHIQHAYRANIHNQLIKNTTRVLMLSFPCTNQWLFHHVVTICKQSDENQSVHKCPFLVVIFWALFQCVMTVSWNQPQPGCWNYLYYIYSFIHANTQHNISNKNSFQRFIFNWSAQLWSA